MNHFRQRFTNVANRIWSGLLSTFFIGLVILIWAANAATCAHDGDTTQKSAANLKIVELDRNNQRHLRLEHTLEKVWSEATPAHDEPLLLIVDSSEINAASFGFGRFLVWDGVADLSESNIEAIFAHEIAHDSLRHSKKAQELKELTDFFGDVLSVFARTDRDTENTLKRWFGYTALPKYSRNQEFEADARAVTILSLLGEKQPKKQLRDALQVLLDKYGNAGGGFLDSHPSTMERIQRLSAMAEHPVAK